MPIFGAGVKTGAGNTTWPSVSIFSEANTQVNVLQVYAWNTSSTVVDIRLARISSGPGTVGAALTKTPFDNPAATCKALAFTTHTGGTPTLTDLGIHASLGAYGSFIWPFDGQGIEIAAAAGTATGLCIVTDNGTGQALQAGFVWLE